MGDGIGQAPKKETVYSGPTPTMDNRAFAQPTAAAGGTVYGGPAPAGSTVFDPTAFKPKKADDSLARTATTKRVQRASWRFFIVAGVSLLEMFGYASNGDVAMAIASAIVVLIFGLIGFFAYRLSKKAFLVAMALYGLETLFLVGTALQIDGGFILLLYPIVIHGLILYRLYVAYGLIHELNSE